MIKFIIFMLHAVNLLYVVPYSPDEPFASSCPCPAQSPSRPLVLAFPPEAATDDIAAHRAEPLLGHTETHVPATIALDSNAAAVDCRTAQVYAPLAALVRVRTNQHVELRRHAEGERRARFSARFACTLPCEGASVQEECWWGTTLCPWTLRCILPRMDIHRTVGC